MRALLLAAALLYAAHAAHAADDPLTGRWELNLARSKYDPGPPPKAAVRIQQLEGGVLKVALEILFADGKSGDATYTARLDGREYPVGQDGKDGTIAWRRIDARALEYRRKRGGEIVETGRIQVSEDGQRMTVSAKGVNAAGRRFEDVIVYDRWTT